MQHDATKLGENVFFNFIRPCKWNASEWAWVVVVVHHILIALHYTIMFTTIFQDQYMQLTMKGLPGTMTPPQATAMVCLERDEGIVGADNDTRLFSSNNNIYKTLHLLSVKKSNHSVI